MQENEGQEAFKETLISLLKFAYLDAIVEIRDIRRTAKQLLEDVSIFCNSYTVLLLQYNKICFIFFLNLIDFSKTVFLRITYVRLRNGGPGFDPHKRRKVS